MHNCERPAAWAGDARGQGLASLEAVISLCCSIHRALANLRARLLPDIAIRCSPQGNHSMCLLAISHHLVEQIASENNGDRDEARALFHQRAHHWNDPGGIRIQRMESKPPLPPYREAGAKPVRVNDSRILSTAPKCAAPCHPAPNETQPSPSRLRQSLRQGQGTRGRRTCPYLRKSASRSSTACTSAFNSARYPSNSLICSPLV